MLANFFSWWLARVTELLPRSWSSTNVAPRDGIVIDVDGSNNLAAYSRRRGQLQPLTLGAAARLAAKRPVILRPRGGAVLVKHHTVPTLPRLQLDQLLRHELARITPFPASDLYWHWDRRPKRGDGSRTDVTLTMVPKMALGTAVAALDKAGVKADFIETGPADRPCLLPTRDRADRASGKLVVRGLAWTCASLAIIAVVLPVVLQALALQATNSAIAKLQPTTAQVEAMRRAIASGDAGRDILVRETERTGDLLRILAAVTRILPDDTFLTDFSLRDRKITLSGRSASAPRLITGLSADPTIRNAAFAAPVTRIEGATSDMFSIKAEVAP